jgi:hypothetical protein
MKRMLFLLIIPAVFVLVSACVHDPTMGFIYTHKTSPLDLDLSQTPMAEKQCESDIKHFHYYVDIKWDTNAIGDIARKNGIETLYFADMETLSILGIWKQHTVHVYGK